MGGGARRASSFFLRDPRVMPAVALVLRRQYQANGSPTSLGAVVARARFADAHARTSAAAMGDEFWLPTQALLQGPSPLVNKPKARRERPARARMDLARISPSSPRDADHRREPVDPRAPRTLPPPAPFPPSAHSSRRTC